MKYGEFYSLEDLFHKYGSRERVFKLSETGSIPDPWFEKDAVDEDIECRLRRGERLPAELEEELKIYGTHPESE